MKKFYPILLIVFVGGAFMLSKSLGSSPLKTLNNSTSTQSENNSVKLISSAEFVNITKEQDAFIIDVHTPKQTHIPGTDALIPFDQIKDYQDQLPVDKSTPIIVYCRSGNMSATASEEIASLGYSNVYDLEGGTNVYKEQEVSVEIHPNKQDLGKVIYGDVATTSFTLTNYTPLPMKITRVSTSCGCTKASVEKETLSAYESTTVNVSFDPAVHKDDTDLGELTRTIYIETDNPNFTDLESIITANVIKES